MANSPLVKTAVFGNDPNWGRICCAAGYAGVPFDVNEFSLQVQGKTVMRNGLPTRFEREALKEALKEQGRADPDPRRRRQRAAPRSGPAT